MHDYHEHDHMRQPRTELHTHAHAIRSDKINCYSEHEHTTHRANKRIEGVFKIPPKSGTVFIHSQMLR